MTEPEKMTPGDDTPPVTGDDQPAADDTALDDLDDEAKRTRAAGIEAGILTDPEQQRFHESGSIRPDLDDQNIAPPG